jgi:hypothetical protein
VEGYSVILLANRSHIEIVEVGRRRSESHARRTLEVERYGLFGGDGTGNQERAGRRENGPVFRDNAGIVQELLHIGRKVEKGNLHL